MPNFTARGKKGREIEEQLARERSKQKAALC